MDQNHEIDPALAVDYPLERARLYHLYAGIDALKMARSRMPEDKPLVIPRSVVEAVPVIQEPEQRTASDNLAEIREQIRREAA